MFVCVRVVFLPERNYYTRLTIRCELNLQVQGQWQLRADSLEETNTKTNPVHSNLRTYMQYILHRPFACSQHLIRIKGFSEKLSFFEVLRMHAFFHTTFFFKASPLRSLGSFRIFFCVLAGINSLHPIEVLQIDKEVIMACNPVEKVIKT